LRLSHAIEARLNVSPSRTPGGSSPPRGVRGDGSPRSGGVWGGRPPEAAASDMRAQLSGLIYPGFVTATGYRRLPQLSRYLRGIERRLDKLAENPGRDAANMAVAQRAEQAYRQAVADLPAARREDPDVAGVRWLLEELRVSLFAQTLGTQVPVSENRVMAALARLRP
ncbi:MAG: DUF3418 domain-containing protein, partial [Actinobacteria bacterium]|nr:DUF3418 domain-containing protein [Actinomycetota bacterium]